jgi:carboxyl-terminal processing protease
VRRLIAVVLLVPLALVGGIWLGGHPEWLPGGVRDTLVADSEGRLYEEALDMIASDFYRPVNRRRLLDQSLESAVDSLKDPFSAYLNPEQYMRFQESTTGEFEGVGMNVEEHARGLKVLTVFKGSPARAAGLKAGDLIVAVDGKSIRGMSSEEATALIKGPAGTTVRLSVQSGDRRRELSVERARVNVPVVESRMRRSGDMEVAHVHLASFTSGAHGEVGRAVKRLLDKGADGVVLDLRDNGGGLLNEAVLVSSVFIPEGTIVTTKGRSRPRKVFEATGGAIDPKIPVVVLVNGNSASASEIVTGALQDRERATVVGTKTFGKGVFQEIERLSSGGALDITVGEYFTPKGRNLGGHGTKRGGIQPDVKAADDAKTPRDEALDVALETVAKATA